MNTIVLTGFEPFGGSDVNPSWLVAKALDGWQPEPNWQVKSYLLPCSFGLSQKEIEQISNQVNPSIFICLGQASGRSKISIEKVAINYDDARIPDNSGNQPTDKQVITDGPDAYFTTLPIKSIVKKLIDNNFPAELSLSAGSYVCNHVFYTTQNLLLNKNVKSGFIHIPNIPQQSLNNNLPSMPLDFICDAIKLAIIETINTSEDISTPMGKTE